MQKNNGNPSAEVWIQFSGEVLVRRPEKGSPWVKISSPEGREVINPPRDPQGFVAFPSLPN